MVLMTKLNIFIVGKIFRFGLEDELHIDVIDKNGDINYFYILLFGEDFWIWFRRLIT